MRALSGASIVAIAAACHAANAAYCRSIGDDSQPSWDKAPDWQRASALAGVEFHLANPAAGDAASHENWMQDKLADGWKLGEAKDAKKKEHPCLVPFDQLPPEQQFKDALFRTVVHSMAAGLAPLGGQLTALSTALMERGLVKPEDADADGFDPVAVAISAIDVHREEVTRLMRVAAGHKGQATRARAQAAAAMPARLRKFGPVDKQLPPGDLLELIAAAETVELAFTDGRTELKGLAPRTIEGGAAAWQLTSRGRLRLNVPELTILGPGPDKSAWQLGGYALLADGEQIAWQARDPVMIAPGTRHEFRDDVIFG